MIIYFKNLIWVYKNLLAKVMFTSQKFLEIFLVNEPRSGNLYQRSWSTNLSLKITENFNVIFEFLSS